MSSQTEPFLSNNLVVSPGLTEAQQAVSSESRQASTAAKTGTEGEETLWEGIPQYVGRLGSTSLIQAKIPPFRFCSRVNPAPWSNVIALALRTPLLQ
jgi:hypothetical protein